MAIRSKNTPAEMAFNTLPFGNFLHRCSVILAIAQSRSARLRTGRPARCHNSLVQAQAGLILRIYRFKKKYFQDI